VFHLALRPMVALLSQATPPDDQGVENCATGDQFTLWTHDATEAADLDSVDGRVAHGHCNLELVAPSQAESRN
jgi:hypothetical protein